MGGPFAPRDGGGGGARHVPLLVQIVLDEMADAVLIHRAGTILYANPAAALLAGLPDPESLVGQSVLTFLHPDSHAEAEERIRSTIELGRPMGRSEFKVRRADGVRTVQIAPVKLLELESGTASLIVARDISDRRHMQEQLLNTDRLSAMGALAAAVVHEINNPLTFVLGNLTVAARRIDESDLPGATKNELLRALADARSGAERVRNIVGDLRSFARPDQGVSSRLDIRKVVDAVVSLVWGELRHRARLVKEYGAIPTVLVSETRLSQVILMLTLTSLRAIEEGAAARNQLRITTGTTPDGWARLEFRDTGTPFEDRDIAAMWTSQGAASSPAAGLTLAACRAIIEDARGTIVAYDGSDAGLRFDVRLPPTQGPADISRPVLAVRPAVSSGRARVLVVDDEPVVATLIERALEGHQVYVTSGGRDALELCRDATIDVVLCDLLMPDLTGMAFYEQVQALRPELKDRIVFMTAGAFTTRARDFLASIPNLVLHKPFELDDVAEAVDTVLFTHGNAP